MKGGRLFDGVRLLCLIFLIAFCLVAVPHPVLADASFRRGDANVDGNIDISDVCYIFRYVASLEMDDSTCLDAMDVRDNEIIDIIDAITLLNFLITGRDEPPAPGPFEPGPDPDGPELGCAAYEPADPSSLAEFTLRFEQPAVVVGPGPRYRIFATLTTSNNTAGVGAEGWSLSVGAENLHVVDATTAGTAGARRASDPYGIRTDHGSERTLVIDPTIATEHGPQGEGAVSIVLLSMNQDVSLPVEGTQRLLAVTVEPAAEPGDMRGRLMFRDGLIGNRPMENVVSLLGTRQQAAGEALSIRLDDCNGNDRPDDEDVAAGSSLDCNENAIPDECEIDCNENGVPDSCDIASLTSLDCNQDGIPDECYPPLSIPTEDCNENGVPDNCDITYETSEDCNGNRIPDECELSSGVADCNANGILDVCEIAAGEESDCNANGLLDSCDLAAGRSADTNMDGILDECEGCDPVEPVVCEGDQPLFRYSFRGACSIAGYQGASVSIPVVSQLETYCLEAGRPGVQGWSLSIAVEGCDVLGVTTDGTAAAPVESGGLRWNGFESMDIINPALNDGKKGVVSANVLSFMDQFTLDPGGSPHDILRISLGATIPFGEDCTECRVLYHDGLRGRGGPVSNNLTYNGMSFNPLLVVPFRFRLCPIPGGAQIPFDGNQDGKTDLSDAVFILGRLFLGEHPVLPCGDALQEGGNLLLFDATGDRRVDISDPIRMLTHLFLGGPPPVLGVECIGLPGCPNVCRE